MTASLGSVEDLVSRYAASPNRLMWFLGAGASRTAGMPTATDLIWELKLRLYCRDENQNLQTHDAHSHAIRARVQSYFDSRGAPPAYSPAEYSFYFEQAFGDDYAAQQRFLQSELSADKISLNVGQRVLGALIAMGAAKVVFTTNFDEVVETAVASVSGQAVAAFHLEGSYAALDALNADRFPIYAKLHGDFRYRSLKNLSADLLSNDQQIQRCFLAAANRFGMIITGYSGRDANVTSMIRTALNQANPFPSGLYWTTPRRGDLADDVEELIAEAAAKGVRAAIVEAGTFDILLSKLWRQLPEKPSNLIEKVRPSYAAAVSIPLPAPGTRYPVLRTNALAVTSLPRHCGHLVCKADPSFEAFREAQEGKIPEAAMALENGVLFWGATSEVEGIIGTPNVKDRTVRTFSDPLQAIEDSTLIKSLFEHALAKALCADNPVVLRKRGRTWYAVASTRKEDEKALEPLRRAVGWANDLVPVSGRLQQLDASWAEALSIRLEVRNGSAWLLLEPDIWIAPLSKRDQAVDFSRKRRLKRYNEQSNRILDAWLDILFGGLVRGSEATVTAFASDDHPAGFTINTRTAFSGGAQLNVG